NTGLIGISSITQPICPQPTVRLSRTAARPPQRSSAGRDPRPRQALKPVFTAAEMRALDRRATAELGIAGSTLMENAGRGAAAEIQSFLVARKRPLRGLAIVVVCGKGNNGGDGFVVARRLAGGGARVRVFLIGRALDVRGDAASKLARLAAARLRPVEVTDSEGIGGL